MLLQVGIAVVARADDVAVLVRVPGREPARAGRVSVPSLVHQQSPGQPERELPVRIEVIPALLGGLDTLMIGHTLYEEFFVNRDWPLSCAVAIILLLILILPLVLFQHFQQETEL